MTPRIHRGFHRIGIILTAFPLVGAGWLGVSERNWQADTEAAQARVLASLSDADLEKITVGTRMPTALPEVHHVNSTTVVVLHALAVALYGAARSVAWVLDDIASMSNRIKRHREPEHDRPLNVPLTLGRLRPRSESDLIATGSGRA